MFEIYCFKFSPHVSFTDMFINSLSHGTVELGGTSTKCGSD